MASREEEKARKTSQIILAVFCISLIGGYAYYVKHPEIIWGDEASKYPERIVDLTETTDAEFQKILDDIQITTEENFAIEQDIQVKDDYKREYKEIENNFKGREETEQLRALLKKYAGYDENGYKYTFKDNGLGEPNELPPKKDNIDVVNPNTGVMWVYNKKSGWHKDTWEEEQAEVDRMQNRVVGQMGNMTDEQAKEFVKNMTINMGSMN